MIRELTLGLLTLEEFREDLNFALGDKKQSGNRRLDRWINKAYFEVCNEVEFEALKESTTASLVASQQEYTLPTDLLALITVSITEQDRFLIQTGQSKLRRLDPDSEGTPKYYARRDRTLYLWPVPDSGGDTLVLDYIEEPCAMSAATDTSQIPQQWDQAIHWLGMRNALLDLREREEATFYFQTAMNYINRQMTEAEHGMETEKQGFDVATTEDDIIRMRS